MLALFERKKEKNIFQNFPPIDFLKIEKRFHKRGILNAGGRVETGSFINPSYKLRKSFFCSTFGLKFNELVRTWMRKKSLQGLERAVKLVARFSHSPLSSNAFQ